MGDPAVIDRRSSLEFVHRIWPGRPGQLAPLRAEVRRWPAPLGLPGRAEDALVLALREAASNCVEHAYSPPTADDIVGLTFWTEPHAFCIHIIDHGEWRTPCDQPTRRGRGIAIMQQLIALVLIRHDARGTRLFLRHLLPGEALNALHLTPSDSS